jgi:hypothetical protein
LSFQAYSLLLSNTYIDAVYIPASQTIENVSASSEHANQFELLANGERFAFIDLTGDCEMDGSVPLVVGRE